MISMVYSNKSLSLFYILISMVVFVTVAILQEIHHRQNFFRQPVQSFLIAIPINSPMCVVKTHYTEFKIPSCERYQTSSALAIVGRVEPVSDEAIFRRKRLIITEISSYRLSLFSPKDWNLLMQHYLLSSRQYLYSLLLESLGKYYGGLVIAVVLGNTDWLVESIQPYFEITGTLHILAASGQNVALVMMALESILPTHLNRMWKGTVYLVGVAAYLGIVGLQPSITRAAAMAAIQLFSRYYFLVQYNVMYSLFLSTGILLLLRPDWVTSIGFLLSVLSTLAIILLFPIFEASCIKLIKKMIVFRNLKQLKEETTMRSYIIESIAAGLAAEVATLPILLAQFGSAQTLAFIPSLAVGWVVPIMMNGTLLLVLVTSLLRLLLIPIHGGQMISHTLALILVTIPTDIFLGILSYMSRFNWGTVTNPWYAS